MPRAAAAVLAALTIALAAAGAARADGNLFVGVVEDGVKHGPQAAAIAHDLNLTAIRITLQWNAGQTELRAADQLALDAAMFNSGGARLVLSIYDDNGWAPLTPAERDNYCWYVRNVVGRYPAINDVVIWNEPNLSYFWHPQFNPDSSSAAPAAYTALLARCWDVLHDFRPGINVIGPATSLRGNDDPFAPSNISHNPATFIRRMGEAFRASGRARPLFDTVAHHPHPRNAQERPWKTHDDLPYISLGDWGKLTRLLSEAFEGTAQPIPGQGVPIWYAEVGFQTSVATKPGLYTGTESWPNALPDWAGGEPDTPVGVDTPAPDQATQLLDSVRLAYCQPYVEAFFNFLLWDERALERWQSGVLWADWTPKGSYNVLARAAAEVRDGRVDCSALKGGPLPQPVHRPPSSTSPPGGGGNTPAPPVSPPGVGTAPNPADARATTALVYTGSRRARFGYGVLSARLSRLAPAGVIAGRPVSFVAGNRLFGAVTDAKGVARAKVALPVPVGRWLVKVSFGGNAELRPSSAEQWLSVDHSRVRVRSLGVLRGRYGIVGRIDVGSDGKRIRGRVAFRGHGFTLTARRLTGLGTATTGKAAWISGFTTRGKRFYAYVVDRRLPARDLVRIWVDDTARLVPGDLRQSSVEITPLARGARLPRP